MSVCSRLETLTAGWFAGQNVQMKIVFKIKFV